MELNDAVRRIIWQHRALIGFFLLLGLGAGLAIHLERKPQFTASARLVLDTSDPKTQPESAAIADIAKAIATSPFQVSEALKPMRLNGRDPADIALHHVDAQSLGSSGIVQLSVSDSNARAASMIANALARRVIATRLKVTQGQAADVGARLDRRIATLGRQIASADTRIDRLTVKSAALGDPVQANAVRASRDDELRRRDFLAQQRSVLESQRATLLSNGASLPQPAVISTAAVPQHADASGTLADLVLGAILGLVLGIGTAALIESLRPTLVDGDAIGVELDAPVLGTLADRPDRGLRHDELIWTAARLRLAARSAQVRHIGLIRVRPGLDLRDLSDKLEAALATSSARAEAMDTVVEHGAVARPAATRPLLAASAHEPEAAAGLRISPYDPASPSSANGTVIGLVVVSPSPLRKQELGDTDHLLRVSGGPLLGVITYSA